MQLKGWLFVGGSVALVFLTGFCSRPETIRTEVQTVTKEGVPVPYLHCVSIQGWNPEHVYARTWEYDEYDENEELTKHTKVEPKRPKDVPSDAVWKPAFYAEGAWRSGGRWEESEASVKRRQEESDKRWDAGPKPMVDVGCPAYVEKRFNTQKVDYDDLAKAADRMSDFAWNTVTTSRSPELNTLLEQLRYSLGRFRDNLNRAPSAD